MIVDKTFGDIIRAGLDGIDHDGTHPFLDHELLDEIPCYETTTIE